MEQLIGYTFEVAGRIWNADEQRKVLRRKLTTLESIEADINIQLHDADSSPSKKRKNEVADWFVNVARVKSEAESLLQESMWSDISRNKIEKLIEEVKELIERSRFEGGLVLDLPETSEVPFLTTELVGQAFEVNKKKIWDCLMKDEVLSIAIYGMGGVGKTTLITHIHNRLLESRHVVYWITVSQDFSIFRLQNLIAQRIGLHLPGEDDILKRAAKLSEALDKEQKCVLILDDLWNYFDLREVGISVRKNGCKLILTTRSLDVCRKMVCQEIIKVVPLSEEEAWILFQEKLGEPLPSGVKKIAKLITMECDGLPLGIVIVAGSMRGVHDVSEWRNALRELRESEAREGDMEEKVFQVLRFSYNRLANSALQQCFLNCALFPEDEKIKREELIEYLIDEELIEGENRQAKFDKGHTMLNTLEKVCLLEGVEDFDKERCVRMHDLIRDMAIQIMKRNRVMINAGEQLEEIPDVEKWTVELVKVSLMQNGIREIPCGHSPRCPELSTLLLCNCTLTRIADCFLEQLYGLKILDLSYTCIKELPGSISHLVNLNALLLRGCEDLSFVPSLATLKELKKLDLRDCLEVEVLPEGIEMVCKLNYLDLRGTKIKELPFGKLANLSHLQVLRLDGCVKGNSHKLVSLKKMETLQCCFNNAGEYNTFISTLPSTLNHFLVGVGDSSCSYDEDSGRVYFNRCDFSEEEDAILLPNRVKFLDIDGCSTKRRSLCLKIAQSAYATELKDLSICVCDGTECLLSLSSSQCIFQSLENIHISGLVELRYLFTKPPPATMPFPPHTFSLLKAFKIASCPRMKKLFPPGLVSNLENLETLEVFYCEKMEEIIAKEEEQDSHNNSCTAGFIALPKLRSFVLSYLRELRSICSVNIICNSLKDVKVVNCGKLKRIPLSLVLMDNGQPSPLPSLERMQLHPKEWWESSVELAYPNDKNLLSPFIRYDKEF